MHTDSSRLRVLVVDDCRDTTYSYALLLKTWGHEALTAYDGPAALALARSERPDVILLDLGLPGRSGWDVAIELRQLPELDRVRLIALSGCARDEDHERSHEAGIDFHLIKPADPEVLRRWLEALARSQRPQLAL
jgi:CheY-like chemotaxis protein